MEQINDKMIAKLEKLARLRLSEDERVRIKKDLNKIVIMFDKLSELDTSDAEPLLHINGHTNVLRADTVTGELSHREALSNVPNTKDGYIATPKFLKPKK